MSAEEPRTSFSWRRAWPAIAAVVVVVGTLAIRSTVEHMQAYRAAVALEQQGKLDAAIDEYRWALRWYTPWGPWHGDAAEALWELGSRSAADHPERTIRAWDSLRSGLLTGRSFYQPQAALLAKVNGALPPVLVRVAERRGDTRSKEALLKRFTADYQRPVGVPAWASLAVSFGFILWVLGLVMAFARGTDERGKLRGAGWRWLGISALGFAAWAGAMWVA